MWLCALFLSRSGCLLGFGNPRGVMFLLLALCCQASWCVFHGKANGSGFCCVLCVLVVFFVLLFFNFSPNSFSAVVSGDLAARALNRPYFAILLPFRNMIGAKQLYLCVCLCLWS